MICVRMAQHDHAEVSRVRLCEMPGSFQTDPSVLDLSSLTTTDAYFKIDVCLYRERCD